MEEATAFFELDLDRFGKNVSIQRHFPDQPLSCQVDTEQFQQVILNLLLNAMQALRGEGTIHMEVLADERAENPYAVLCVRDTGIGIDEEVREKLFTPFFTTKEDGTGLGLVNSKKIVEAHGGNIRVESIPGEGTSFFVALPR